MKLDLAINSAAYHKSDYREPADISMGISAKIDSKIYAGTVELRDGDVRVTTGSGNSATAAVTGAPPIVIALDLLKYLSSDQTATQKAPPIAAGSYGDD